MLDRPRATMPLGNPAGSPRTRSLATIDFEACPSFVPQLTASSTACWRLTVASARRRPIQAKAPQETIDDLLCGWACHLSLPIGRSSTPPTP
jgi:hypothetical protein